MSDEQPTPEIKPIPDDALPAVTPPAAGFILQLFLIPMIIVGVVVVVWVMFSWLAQVGSDPQKLIASLEGGDKFAWQQASTLSEMLRDPQQAHLLTDQDLAIRLAKVLDKQIDIEKKTPNLINLEVFLCRALGEFRIPDGLPTLIRAAKEEKTLQDISVRRSALEAIAVKASKNDAKALRDNEELMEVVIAAASDRKGESGEQTQQRAMLRSTAVYTLGVLGGEEALNVLYNALDDSQAIVRYNAATGLSRHGDPRAIPMLLEMLDPDNPYAVQAEETEEKKSPDKKLPSSVFVWKRLSVLKNGLKASQKLVETNPAVERKEIIAAIQNLIESDMKLITARNVKRGIHENAKGVLNDINAIQVPTSSGPVSK